MESRYLRLLSPMSRPFCFLELLARKLSELHDVTRDVSVVIMLLFWLVGLEFIVALHIDDD